MVVVWEVARRRRWEKGFEGIEDGRYFNWTKSLNEEGVHRVREVKGEGFSGDMGNRGSETKW